jgi:large subunit ribosomal protein L7e
MTSNINSSSSGGGGTSGALQLVPETILKKKHDLDELRAQRAAHLLQHPKNNKKRHAQKKDGAVKIMKPEAILSAARSKRNHTTRWNRVAKKGMQARASTVKKVAALVSDPNTDTSTSTQDAVQYYATNSVDAKLVFCVRIRDAFGMPPPIKKALSQFGLRNVYEGVFIQYTPQNKKLLHLIEPFVTYGIPSKAVILDLLQRRGHGKIDGKKIPLSDNTVIEQALGSDTGILCLEDLVHEISTVGENFERVQKFLWPFQLESVRTRYQKDLLHRTDGGEYGDRGEGMDAFIKQIL